MLGPESGRSMAAELEQTRSYPRQHAVAALVKGSVNTAIDLCDLDLNTIGTAFWESRLEAGFS